MFNVFRKKANGELVDLEGADKVAITNCFISSCFSNLSISLNGTIVESHSQLAYPYISYLQQLLSTSKDYKSDVRCS